MFQNHFHALPEDSPCPEWNLNIHVPYILMRFVVTKIFLIFFQLPSTDEENDMEVDDLGNYFLCKLNPLLFYLESHMMMSYTGI